jgi:quercetin dioxygenase-like cupin family protein
MELKDLNKIAAKSPFPGFQGKFIRSGQMTFVYWDIVAGVLLPEHSHPHEQVVHPLEGQFEMTVNGVTRILGPGSICIIPPNAVHSGRALTECRILDVFSPVREDYIAFEDR